MSKRASTLIRRLAVVFAGFVVASLAQAQPVRIGAVYSISGPGSFLGAPEDKVLRALAEEANKKGGVNGHKIELVIYDTEGNTGKAAQQFRRLATSDDVQVVFGPSSSGESLAVKDLANELKVPTLMHGGAEAITKPTTPYVFNTPPTDRISISGLLAHMKKMGITSVAMLSAADGFGQSGKNILNELAPQSGIKIVAQEEFNRTDADMTAQVLKAKSANPDAMLIWSALPGPVVILRAAQAAGFNKPIFTSYGAGTNDLVAQAGGAAEGLYLYSLRLELATSIFSPASSRTAVSSKKDQASSSEVATFASLCWTACNCDSVLPNAGRSFA